MLLSCSRALCCTGGAVGCWDSGVVLWRQKFLTTVTLWRRLYSPGPFQFQSASLSDGEEESQLYVLKDGELGNQPETTRDQNEILIFSMLL